MQDGAKTYRFVTCHVFKLKFLVQTQEFPGRLVLTASPGRLKISERDFRDLVWFSLATKALRKTHDQLSFFGKKTLNSPRIMRRSIPIDYLESFCGIP